MNRGMTLVELLTVLAVTGVLVAMAAPRLAGGADRYLVREAREELVAFLYQARLEARRQGQARVTLTSGGGAELEVPGQDDPLLWEPSVSGLSLEVLGARDEVTLVFGPAGIGRVASATLVIRRGRAEARVVVSSYGRIRR
jgi:prepilin-type N-terminal cleavage/methylation domain-containing protein